MIGRPINQTPPSSDCNPSWHRKVHDVRSTVFQNVLARWRQSFDVQSLKEKRWPRVMMNRLPSGLSCCSNQNSWCWCPSPQSDSRFWLTPNIGSQNVDSCWVSGDSLWSCRQVEPCWLSPARCLLRNAATMTIVRNLEVFQLNFLWQCFLPCSNYFCYC